jgi:UDP-2,3-diacylglucosamine pyrophosphatase LpxH
MSSLKEDNMGNSRIRLNQKTLKVRDKSADVLLLGDVHWGSPQCDKDRFLENLRWCLKTKTYVLLMGDMIELATRESIGAGVYEQEEPGQDQYEEMVEMLRPLSRAGLLLGVLQGNHEFRIWQLGGMNVTRDIAKSLGIPYLGDACWNLWRVGKETYSVYALHGRTAAQFDATVLRAVENISHSFNADLIAMGHAHKAVSGIMLVQTIEHGHVVEKKKFTVVTGSYLKYDGGYWQTRGGRLAKLGSPRVRFFSDRHDLVVSW